MPPTPRCHLTAISATTPLYMTTVSQALRQPLRAQSLFGTVIPATSPVIPVKGGDPLHQELRASNQKKSTKSRANTRKFSTLLYALRICHVADVPAFESIH